MNPVPIQSYDDIEFDSASLKKVLGSVLSANFRIKYGLQRSPFFYNVSNPDEDEYSSEYEEKEYIIQMGDLDGVSSELKFSSREALERDTVFHVLYYAGKIYQDHRNIRLLELGKFNINDFVSLHL